MELSKEFLKEVLGNYLETAFSKFLPEVKSSIYSIVSVPPLRICSRGRDYIESFFVVSRRCFFVPVHRSFKVNVAKYWPRVSQSEFNSCLILSNRYSMKN